MAVTSQVVTMQKKTPLGHWLDLRVTAWSHEEESKQVQSFLFYPFFLLKCE